VKYIAYRTSAKYTVAGWMEEEVHVFWLEHTSRVYYSVRVCLKFEYTLYRFYEDLRVIFVNTKTLNKVTSLVGPIISK